MGSTDRTLVTVAQAVKTLPEAGVIFTFLLVSPKVQGGRPRRIHAPWKREEIINLMEEWGGADVSGDVALHMGYGLSVPHGPGILFIQTRPGVCPLCLGEGKALRHPLHVLKERCWICNGVGRIAAPEKVGN